jgi:tetratricopeptide (TPR) repeat protein
MAPSRLSKKVIVAVCIAALASTLPRWAAGADGDAKEERKDPSDIRNSIGNSEQVRSASTQAAPAKKGLWAQLIDQPYYTPAVRAQKLLFFGQYPEAEARYRDLLKGDPQNTEYALGLLEAILRQGRLADLKRFDEMAASMPEAQRANAKFVRLRAESLLQRGRNAEAREILKRFVDAHPTLEPLDGEALTLYNTYAQALEADAEYPAAAGIYKKLIPLAEGGFPDDSQQATQICFALERAAILTGSGREKHRTVLHQLGQIAQKDATYWPSKLVEAELLLNSHNDKEGQEALNEVLDLNPNELRTRFLAVDYAIQGYNFELAQAELNEIHARSDSALATAYDGRLLLKERLPDQAIPLLQQALEQNPHLAAARGWLAGAYGVLADEAHLQRQLANPDGGAVHPVTLFECAEVLRDARQYGTAETLYMQAMGSAPWWSEPPAALAQLYLETGQETQAKAAYDKSFAIDPYNMRAYNQLVLLNMLQKFSTLESHSRLKPGSDQPAFIIRYEPQDEILAKLAVEWMEKIRPELWSYFQIQDLPEPTQIELFPSHEQFGVRTTGLPWIGTVGACTGNVIAMDVPRGGSADTMGNFDWARVLRHEYTHTITLALTNNRIPHWLTEAAACNQEEAPRDWENCQLLASNYRAGTLFKIADLNWGFIRPKRSIDRQLAYMQSQWIYEYLVATYGLPKMLEFMKCFHDGLIEPKAWVQAYGKTMEEMDTEFHAWAGKEIAGWGLPTDALPKREEVEALIAKNPNDAESRIKLAWLLASGGKAQEARAQLESAIAIDPKNLRGRELLGAILSQQSQTDRARQLLEAVVTEDPHRPLALRTLGLLAMGRHDYDDAEKWFTQLQAERPLEDTSYLNLAGIYLLRKQNQPAIGQLLELERHDQKDERIPRRLSDLFVQEGNLAEAEQSAYRAIRINPYNAINHQTMATVLMDEKDPGRAVEFWRHAVDLQPGVADFWQGLADAQGESGDLTDASLSAKKAVALQPASDVKKWIRQ